MVLIDKIKRGLGKPPKVILQRIAAEIKIEVDRFYSPFRSRRMTERRLLQESGSYSTIRELWKYLGSRGFPAVTTPCSKNDLNDIGINFQIILDKAKNAIDHKIDLLGSGQIELGDRIQWHKDYKSGFSWPSAYIRSIDYNNFDQYSDVKFPWEVSRMQWLIPAGQAFLITGDEIYAEAVKEAIDHWINENPYAYSVNWASTMEVALRIVTWTWFFHVFKNSKAWDNHQFQYKFLSSLYLHADFTQRHLEKSDINGNHYTANAAGLVFAGLFFGRSKTAEKWLQLGWGILCDELLLQVYPDGVDFEASVPYHRFVTELFLFPLIYRLALGYNFPKEYCDRLIRMAYFIRAYSRPDSSVPLWGDADDARALPLGNQKINNHLYLSAVIGYIGEEKELMAHGSGPYDEVYWLLGKKAVLSISNKFHEIYNLSSCAFHNGGFFVMRNCEDHIFIDCGPLGLAGRGGHGHNDCLSFEAYLLGTSLITDSGAYLYTASFRERNNFRSTAYHNTPQVDGEEINRFIRPDYLWNLHNDALPEVYEFTMGETVDFFQGTHSGYERLSDSIKPVRSIALGHDDHILFIHDNFIGSGEHQIEIPYHLHPSVSVIENDDKSLLLIGNGRFFQFYWSDKDDWDLKVEDSRVSPSYGIVIPAKRIVFRRCGQPRPLWCMIAPEGKLPEDICSWTQKVLNREFPS